MRKRQTRSSYRLLPQVVGSRTDPTPSAHPSLSFSLSPFPLLSVASRFLSSAIASSRLICPPSPPLPLFLPYIPLCVLDVFVRFLFSVSSSLFPSFSHSLFLSLSVEAHSIPDPRYVTCVKRYVTAVEERRKRAMRLSGILKVFPMYFDFRWAKA